MLRACLVVVHSFLVILLLHRFDTVHLAQENSGHEQITPICFETPQQNGSPYFEPFCGLAERSSPSVAPFREPSSIYDRRLGANAAFNPFHRHCHEQRACLLLNLLYVHAPCDEHTSVHEPLEQRDRQLSHFRWGALKSLGSLPQAEKDFQGSRNRAPCRCLSHTTNAMSPE